MSSALKYCPKCKKTFESEERFCPEDGAQLQEHRRPGDPLIGRLVAGKYRILDKLGVGGFGSVYRCEDLRFESICAIKILDQHRLEELKAVNAGERFIREARLLKRLSDSSRHADTLKHIVQVLDVDEDHDEGLLYFTMDLVVGRHLLEVLQDKGGPISVDRTIRIARQACKALNLAHPEIVHRDLKPENLMLTEVETGEGIEEIVKILDFGIAKVEGDKRLTQGPAAAMSPGYVAPEQVQRRADYRADLFSLGVILYELLTFHSPWSERKISDPPDEDWFGLIEKSRTIDPKPITGYNEMVPHELEQIVLKLMAKDPEKRYQSAKDLDGALARVEELLEQSRPGSVRVIAGTDGVEVVLRSGRKKIHASTTPATFKGVEPGRYHVRIEDRRYKRESGVVEVHPGAQATVQLRASPRPERPPIGEYLRRYKKQIQVGGAALAALVVVSLGFSAFKAPPLMSESAFTDVVTRSLVEAMEVRSGEVWVELSESVEGSDEYRVRMAGMALQSLARQLRDAGLEIEGRGEGSVTVTGRTSAEGSTVAGLAPTIESLCQTCSAPSEGPAGWYTVTFAAEEWDLDSTTVEDSGGALQTETVGGLSPSFFLPGDHGLELNLWLTQTELGGLAARVEEALAAGRLEEGGDESALTLVADFASRFPDSRTLRRLNDRVAGVYVDRARAADSDLEAEQVAGACLAFAPTYAPCSSLIDSIQTSRRLAQEAADRAAQEEVDRLAQAAADRARQQTEASPQTRVVSSPPPEESQPGLQPTQPVRQDPEPRDPQPEQRQEQTPPPDSPAGRQNPFGADPAVDPGPPVEEEEKEEQPVTPAPPSISRIAIGSWNVAERGEEGLQVSLQLTVQNAPAARWCAAVRLLEENGNAVEDRNGEQQLGGQVAMFADFTPTSGSQDVQLALPLPDGLDRSVRAMIGQTRLQIRGAVWPASCSAVGTSIPEAESGASDVCFIMGGNRSFRPCQ